MRLLWTTDPHLNHVPEQGRERWIRELAAHDADGVVMTGDIAEGNDVAGQLQWIAQSLAIPIYFVLGNHDFYRSSFDRTRQSVIHAVRQSASLHYLTDVSAIALQSGVFLVGDDGWGDATEGDYEGSTIRLNDFPLIEDFRRSGPDRWKQQLMELGAAATDRLRVKLDALPVDARQVLVATHVPPFREACWYQGKTTDNNWAPFFVCGQLGRMLREHCDSHPERCVTVLCGHTHHEGVANIAENLIVYTGAASYGHPDIEGIVTCGSEGIEIGRLRDDLPRSGNPA